jgi:hypothetical protein
VLGDVDCRYNKLKTLAGAPQLVNGDFNCSYNGLKTLTGAPQFVSGDFICSNNQLKTLRGGPQQVNGNFNCSYNQLETLEGGPVKVRNTYFCNNNKLTTLKGIPNNIGDDLWCSSNQLTSFDGCAEVIKGSLYCHNNELLASIKGAPPRFVGRDVRLEGCTKLTSLKNIHLLFQEVHGWFNLTNAGVKRHMLGLLKVRGLQGVVLSDKKLETILRKYFNGGDNIFACALDLIQAGYEEQAKL